MNQVFAGGIALIIAFILWSAKQQSKGSTFLKSQKDASPERNTTVSFVQTKKIIPQKSSKSVTKTTSKPNSSKALINSLEIKKKLTKLISSNPNDRLLAIQIATQWSDKQALPFLRRGLKDSDSRVVIASAAGISSYKGKTIALKKKSQASRPPRNVSLIR